jgi:hypothetical protein
MCCFSLNFSEVVVSELEQFSGPCDISGAAGDAFSQWENALSRSDSPYGDWKNAVKFAESGVGRAGDSTKLLIVTSETTAAKR